MYFQTMQNHQVWILFKKLSNAVTKVNDACDCSMMSTVSGMTAVCDWNVFCDCNVWEVWGLQDLVWV